MKISEPPQFKADFFSNNRKRVKELSGADGPIVIVANGLLQKSGDTTFPFRQDSNFWYLTGIEEPDVVLVIDEYQEYLILPHAEPWREVFDGAVDAESLSKTSGIKNILNFKEGWLALGDRLGKVKQVATIESPPAYIEGISLYTNPARQRIITKMLSYNDQLDIKDIKDVFVNLRSIKQPKELDAIRYAVDHTNRLFKQIINKLPQYSNEGDILSDVIGYSLKHSLQLAYDPVIACGKNATTLHYTKNNAELSGEPILLDIGLSYKNYSADISRTVSVAPDRRFEQVRGAVLEVYDFALDILKPGVMLSDYEKNIEQFMGDKLMSLGLIDENTHEKVRSFYPHSTSHFLGLDVHDVGDYSKPLAENMVLTLEPGIYLPKESLGVRIEDVVLITEGGAESLLSGDLSKV